jgi:RNA polymerase sigma factor (sigma-70 family)
LWTLVRTLRRSKRSPPATATRSASSTTGTRRGSCCACADVAATPTWSTRSSRTRSSRCGGARRATTAQGDVGAWIWGIGVRRLIDHLRRTPAPTAELEEPRTAAASAEEEALRGVEYGDVGVALGRLSPELRAVVQATVLDGLTTREASKLLRIPSGTVKTRMMRARAQLREELV